MSLRDFQERFLKGLLHGETPEDFKAGHHFKVYKNAYVIRLKDSLEEDFPETLAELQDADDVLKSYIHAHPSNSWTLAEYAQHFPEFIKKKYGHALYVTASREWAEWIAHNIGQHEDSSVTPPAERAALHVNPSLQMIEDGEVFHAIYYFNQGLREETFDLKWKKLLDQSMKLRPLDNILPELSVEETEVVAVVEKMSRLGIILGFREGT